MLLYLEVLITAFLSDFDVCIFSLSSLVRRPILDPDSDIIVIQF